MSEQSPSVKLDSAKGVIPVSTGSRYGSPRSKAHFLQVRFA